MAQRTSIEWTDSTWNPVTGCTKVSSGCDNCYAEILAHRLLRSTYLSREPVVHSFETRKDPFALRIWPERLNQPFEWKKPRTVFVNSMSDLFHVDIPTYYLRSIFEVMLQVPQHTFQILTKRPARASRFLRDNSDFLVNGSLPAHIWMGTTIECQEVAYRVQHLESVPAHIRFISCEPLIGNLKLDLSGIHWVIVGGESGIKRRPMKAEWVKAIRDQCIQSYTPFFFKQWGGRTPKQGGRVLDEQLWSEMPKVAIAV